MDKTRSGISIGAAGAVIYFSALLGGYTPLFLLGGLIFLREESKWLKKAVFKAVVLMLFFSALIAVVDTLNEILGVFNNLFEWDLEIPLNFDRVIKNVISIAKTVFFSILGFMALGQKDIPVATIDSAICESDDPTVQ